MSTLIELPMAIDIVGIKLKVRFEKSKHLLELEAICVELLIIGLKSRKTSSLLNFIFPLKSVTWILQSSEKAETGLVSPSKIVKLIGFVVPMDDVPNFTVMELLEPLHEKISRDWLFRSTYH